MSQVNTTQPFRPPFLASAGELPIPWTRWIDMFEDWLLAIGFPTADEHAARKAALLRASLGTEGFRIYSSLVTDRRESYDEAKRHLAAHFDQRASTFYERAQFTRRQQEPGETIAQFVSALREMAVRCDFSAAELDNRVRDQFVAWVASNEIRKRLFQEPATRTLSDVISLATTIERSMSETTVRSGLHTAQGINRVGERDGRNQPKPCYNCGQPGHRPRTDKCPANGKKCSSCGKLHHFAKCCRSSASSKTTQPKLKTTHTTNANQVGYASSCEDADEQVDVTSVHVSSVLGQALVGEYKFVTCQLNGISTELILDLGAKVSLLNSEQYARNFQEFRLYPADLTLRSYTGACIPCTGYVKLDVSIQGKTLPEFRFYVVEKGDSMMGVNLFDAFDGQIHIGETRVMTIPVQLTSATTVSLNEFPTLLKEFGMLKGFQHTPEVDLNVPPVQQKFWHPPIALREAISTELQRMEREGIIERIESSPWMSNVVVAKKKDGNIRLCVNLKDVNKAVIPTRYPLPTMDELTSTLAGSKIFSKIDLKWGYLQVPLTESKRYLTAFVTHEGVFQFKSLPFGICSAPSAYQQIVRKIIENIPGCVNLLDDILIHARTVTEHDERLRQVLARLQHYNATVRASKCVLGVPEVEFNGHIVSANGIRPLQSNVQGIVDIPTPTNAKQLLRWICTTTYYMKFVPSFAEIATPLRALLKHDAIWSWTPECQMAFDRLKEMISAPPVLSHFDVDATTVVSCDASGSAIGACLSNVKDGVERPVAFASRALSASERKYSVSEREALACIWASERWHFYTYGRVFILRTDHQALETLLTSGGTGHRPLRLHRWHDRLMQYNFTVEYRPGKRNSVADCLSRFNEGVNVALDGDDYLSSEPSISTIFGGNTDTPAITQEQLASSSAVDDSFNKIRPFIVNGWPERKQLPNDVVAYYAVREELSIRADGNLTRGERAIIPIALRQQALQLAHEGHPGVVRMKQRCQQVMWWPRMNADIESHVRNCEPCIISGKSIKPVPAPLQPIEWPEKPWRKIAIDIAGEFHAAPQHQRFLLVAVDLHSKWPEVMMCNTITSTKVIEFLTSLFSRFGLVDEIISDNGRQFVSTEFEQFLTNLGIKHHLTALYAPQGNGAVERMNRVLKEGIKAGMADGNSFSQSIKQTLASYRSSVHATTGVSPAKMMYSFDMRMPLSRIKPETKSSSVCETDLQLVRKHVQLKQEQMSARHDTAHRAKFTPLSPGDLVRIKLPTKEHKLAMTFSEPREVLRCNGRTVWLANGQRWNMRRCIFHPKGESADDNEAAEYPIPETTTAEAPAATDQPPTLRRSTRPRKAKDFGPDFV